MTKRKLGFLVALCVALLLLGAVVCRPSERLIPSFPEILLGQAVLARRNEAALTPRV